MRFTRFFFIVALALTGCKKDEPGGGNGGTPDPEPVDPFLSALEELSCDVGQVAKYDGTNWVCDDDIDTDTDTDTDSFASFTCSDGQIPKWDSGAWTCGEDIDTDTDTDTDTQLSDSQVLGAVLRMDDNMAGINATTLQGMDSTDFASAGHHHEGHYTVHVPAQESPTDSGAALLEEFGHLPVDARLVKLDAGTYDIGDSSLNLQAGLVIEGAGPGTTIIKGSRSGSYNAEGALVNLLEDAGLRRLSLENIKVDATADDWVSGVAFNVSGTVRLAEVWIEISSNANAAAVLNLGDDNSTIPDNQFFEIDNCQITVSSSGDDTQLAFGVFNYWDANANVSNTTITMTYASTQAYRYGVYNEGSHEIWLRHSDIFAGLAGNHYSVAANNDPEGTVRLHHSYAQGPIDDQGTVHLVHSFVNNAWFESTNARCIYSAWNSTTVAYGPCVP